MNLRRAMKNFKSFYGKKKGKRLRVELPEERDAKEFRDKARKLGMAPKEYAAYLKKQKAKKPDYSPGSGRYYRGGGSYWRGGEHSRK